MVCAGTGSGVSGSGATFAMAGGWMAPWIVSQAASVAAATASTRSKYAGALTGAPP